MNNQKEAGMIYGILAYTAWGILPLYWKLLKQVPASEILAHRIVWSFVFVIGLLLVYRNLQMIKTTLSNKRNILFISLASILIGINWFTYIWAVNADHVVEASLGYYINPLITVLLGVIVLRERLNRWQGIALAFAIIGVSIITIQYGRIPWIAFTLALSFGFYGLLKKMVHVDSTVGLAVETTVLFPVALSYIILKQSEGIGALGNISLTTTFLLLASGVATATPLLWFAKSAERIELSTLGFLQYISPTITLILGIFVFKETFTQVHSWGFIFIWTALLIYSLSKTNLIKTSQSILVKSRS
ncbi:EamA family transporter RarD [Tepidibacillus infernus]|uniref:EamA family transporter RarD n=1 Tax=Tepidibacillus TaxID=1494427 RepID=UPI000853D4A1|nr:EamA family transporter RarD [Tepidibacillus sp. HK-1]GBF12110.1 putative DMT superfamily transporter inner membrane protein [Tepidibacillus sp. HK-1]